MGFELAICDLGGQILTEQQSIVFMQLSEASAMASMDVEEKRSRIIGYHDEKLERYKMGTYQFTSDPVNIQIKKVFTEPLTRQ